MCCWRYACRKMALVGPDIVHYTPEVCFKIVNNMAAPMAVVNAAIMMISKSFWKRSGKALCNYASVIVVRYTRNSDFNDA